MAVFQSISGEKFGSDGNHEQNGNACEIGDFVVVEIGFEQKFLNDLTVL